jgi:indole-3-glycerol phosphate synthase
MTSILQTIIAQKRIEVMRAKQDVPIERLIDECQDAAPPRNFLDALKRESGVALIAEIKKASPSRGLIREDFDPLDIATIYHSAGASCISVLTDEQFFQGRISYLADLRRAVRCPLLRKDFIVDPYQVYQSRVAGADAVLLIAECLSATALKELHDLTASLQMTPLVEFHHANKLPVVLDLNPVLVGINNRDLNTFVTDLNHCLLLRESIPAETIVVAESGISTPADVASLARAGIQAMLVGECLMRAADVAQAVRNLLQHNRP